MMKKTKKEKPVKCQWFLNCKNDAVTSTPHPILGSVPTCKRCDDFAK